MSGINEKLIYAVKSEPGKGGLRLPDGTGVVTLNVKVIVPTEFAGITGAVEEKELGPLVPKRIIDSTGKAWNPANIEEMNGETEKEINLYRSRGYKMTPEVAYALGIQSNAFFRILRTMRILPKNIK